MASGTLYTYPENFRAYKILIAAQYGGNNVKICPNFVFGETNKTPEFLKKFPLGKVPAFETKDGHFITESNAIAYYVANNELRGNNDVERAQVLQWLSYADSDVLEAVNAWTFPYIGALNYDDKTVNTAKSKMTEILKKLNEHLLAKTYLVGERITLADVILACTLLRAYVTVLDPEYRKPYINVNRWFTTIVNQPKVLSVIGATKLCDSKPQVPKKEAGKGDAGESKKEKKKEKKPAPKKEEKEPAEEMDEAEMALAAEPKSKDPFAELPKGTFIMDDFKRSYSNEEVDVSIPYFWKHFDKDNYSIWLGEYKYNQELQKIFMSCNLVTGMFQRLGNMCKNAFGSVCIFGKDNDVSISGVWVWRGQGLAFDLSPNFQVDYESYKWTKLDPTNASQKKMIDEYLAWTAKDKDGRAFNQGKIFK